MSESDDAPISLAEIQAILDRTRSELLGEQDAAKLMAILDLREAIERELKRPHPSMRRLRQLARRARDDRKRGGSR